VAINEKEHSKNSARENYDDIASTMPNQFRPNFWQPQLMGPQPSPISIQQFQQAQSSWKP
jgi:hypothetical protein